MTLVSIKEFSTNQEKYFRMALNERIFIKNGNHTFFVTTVNEHDDYDDDDTELLALAKSKMAEEDEADKELNADEIINYLLR